jgi:hypothetical protein
MRGEIYPQELSRRAGAFPFLLGRQLRVGRVLSSLDAPQATRPSTGPLFEELPSGKTGIIWKHDNGRSPECYLPETCGSPKLDRAYKLDFSARFGVSAWTMLWF